MTKDDVIRMAREAGCSISLSCDVFVGDRDNMGRFAALVAAAEREECAKLCDEASEKGSNVAYILAKAIRARGQE